MTADGAGVEQVGNGADTAPDLQREQVEQVEQVFSTSIRVRARLRPPAHMRAAVESTCSAAPPAPPPSPLHSTLRRSGAAGGRLTSPTADPHAGDAGGAPEAPRPPLAAREAPGGPEGCLRALRASNGPSEPRNGVSEAAEGRNGPETAVSGPQLPQKPSEPVSDDSEPKSAISAQICTESAQEAAHTTSPLSGPETAPAEPGFSSSGQETAPEGLAEPGFSSSGQETGRERPVHRLRLARPSPQVARRLGVNANTHVRVWCECQSGQAAPPGTFPSGPYWAPERPQEAVAADPRRLGGWDALGVADNRLPGSAIALFRAHVEEVEGEPYEQAVSRGRVRR